jgi:hypothetical protein
VWKTTGRKPRELEDIPLLPEEVGYIWDWYLRVRGHEPLTYSEIASWAALTGADPSPAEVEAIRRLDQLNWSTSDD